MNDLTEVQSAVQRAVTVLVDVIQRGVGGELGIRVELPHRDLAVVRTQEALTRSTSISLSLVAEADRAYV